jgi:hypothetical protein
MLKKIAVFYFIFMITLILWTPAVLAADRIILKNVIGKKGTGGGALNSLSDIYFDNKGNIFAADSSNHKIIKYNSDGKFLMEFGRYGADPGELDYPYQVAVDPNGNIFVEDYHDLNLITDPHGDSRSYYRVQKFAPNGDLLWSVGAPGKGNGEFGGSLPAIETDKEGNLYVLDRYNYRVQKFSPDGKFLTAFGRYGNKNGEFDSPSMLLVDDDFNIYVSDPGNFRIQKFDRKGKFILAFGQEGNNDGEFRAPYPSQIYFDQNRNLCAMTYFTFYTSGKRRYIKCLVQKFDLDGNFKRKLYAIERFYDDDTYYSLSYFLSDAADNLYLFQNRDKTLNQYQFRRVGINWAGMTKNYSIELRKPTEGNSYTYNSTTSTTENTRSLTGWNPKQTLSLNYEMDDLTNIYLSNDTSFTSLTGPRDEKTISGTTTWTSWEGTRTIFTNSTYLTLRRTFDKTKNKDVTYTLNYTYNDYTNRWAVKAPEINEPNNYSYLNTSANVDLSDFSDLEIGYNKNTSQYTYDYSKYSNYISIYDYPSDYAYMKYHVDF